jgi:predicted RND superfamily exporter protein
MAAFPATPAVLAPLMLSIGGIAFVLASRNVRAKRIVLPITIVVFSAVWFEMFRRASAQTMFVLVFVALALVANGLWVYRRIGYCSRCGRTVQDLREGAVCKGCAAVI